jgi:hypothetical protein
MQLRNYLNPMDQGTPLKAVDETLLGGKIRSSHEAFLAFRCLNYGQVEKQDCNMRLK